MKGLATIYRRELAALFIAPLAWILLAISFALTGWLFVTILQDSGGDISFSIRFAGGESLPYWGFMIFLPPLLTMRTISEESRNGLLEFLMTAPVSDGAIVLGKFFAAWTFMAAFWSSNLVYAAALQGLGSPPDWPPVLGGYLGALLVSGLFCSIGMFASAVTATPVLAAFGAFAGACCILLLPNLAGLFDNEWLHEEVASVDVMAHFHSSFLIGLVDTKVLVFFLVWTAFFLFLSARSVESKRWR
ncbi:MAG: ABC-2 type transport system permease protein [Planctomycetota bacterium]|jgi:ABC-2 type transport system permease protein